MSHFPSIPPRLSRFILAQLCASLPPPPDDDPDTREARDLIAMTAITRLGPANAAEATLAVNAIAAQAHATDCLRAATHHHDDFRKAAQCRAQSAMMMRQAALALRELRTLQETRMMLMAAREDAEIRQAPAACPETPAATDATTAEPDVPGLPRFAQAWVREADRFRSHPVRWYAANQYSETHMGQAHARDTARPPPASARPGMSAVPA
jgi:hypothetical protein